MYVSLQVARRIYKGIPEKMRGLIWSLLLGVEQEAKKNAGVYEVSINTFTITNVIPFCPVTVMHIHISVYMLGRDFCFVVKCP